ncbi:hypothetical protein [Shewanella marisflavi]|uniref:hypothetical protein n=1 Tax=Shewanella marisflavi TaxID=260364 RepID=UPI003AAA2EDF
MQRIQSYYKQCFAHDSAEINLYKLLQRAGVSLMPLSYGLWSQQKALCIDHICKQFGIAPTQEVA